MRATSVAIVVAVIILLLILFRAGSARAYDPADLAPTTVCKVSSKTQMLCLHNYTRGHHGLQPLNPSPVLYTVAGLKGDKVDRCGVFTHFPCGSTNAFEFFPAGTCGYCGENLAYGYSTIRLTYIAWLNSPGHYANIINPNFRLYGSSFRLAAPFPYLWTTDFASAPYVAPTMPVPIPTLP